VIEFIEYGFVVSYAIVLVMFLGFGVPLDIGSFSFVFPFRC
jgi:hypothetical protein